jgi:hypothetical protein
MTKTCVRYQLVHRSDDATWHGWGDLRAHDRKNSVPQNHESPIQVEVKDHFRWSIPISFKNVWQVDVFGDDIPFFMFGLHGGTPKVDVIQQDQHDIGRAFWIGEKPATVSLTVRLILTFGKHKSDFEETLSCALIGNFPSLLVGTPDLHHLFDFLSNILCNRQMTSGIENNHGS